MSDSNDCNRQEKLPLEDVGRSILVLRRQRIILYADLAFLYGVATKVLNQTVKRNIKRFPADFTFRLTRSETEALKPVTVCDRFTKAPRPEISAVRLY